VSGFLDLVGLPYKALGTDPKTGVDCLWTVREGLRRIFPGFSGSELPSTRAEIDAALAGDGIANRWKLVGISSFDARKVGDILQTEAKLPSGEVETGIALLVDPVGRIALGALRGPGVILRPVAKIGRVVAVWRRP
jgi:hypothetical protein